MQQAAKPLPAEAHSGGVAVRSQCFLYGTCIVNVSEDLPVHPDRNNQNCRFRTLHDDKVIPQVRDLRYECFHTGLALTAGIKTGLGIRNSVCLPKRMININIINMIRFGMFLAVIMEHLLVLDAQGKLTKNVN